LSEVCLVLGNITAAKGNKWLRKWLEAIQRRVNFTTRIVNQYRSVKMAGLSKLLFMKLLRFRDEEIEISKAFRVYDVVIFGLGEFSY
jgi:ATP-binding cassette, subfamily C (CFTR/MRP), member 1